MLKMTLIKLLPLFYFAILWHDAQGLGIIFKMLPSNWSYGGPTGPGDWCQLGYKGCCGRRQSPIDLNLFHVHHILNNIQPANYDVAPKQIHLENLADTVKLSIVTNNPPTISFEDVSIKYVLDNIHFHWGGNSMVGSEHTINGERYPLEAHVVHRDSRYSTADEASQFPGGLVVLAALYKISAVPNNDLSGLIHDLKHVRYAKDTYNDVAPFAISKLLPNLFNGGSYFTYNGSLTTPPCTENVRWVIFRHHVPISESQMQAFRFLQSLPRGKDPTNSHPLINNFRPAQPLHNRLVSWCDLPFAWN